MDSEAILQDFSRDRWAPSNVTRIASIWLRRHHRGHDL